MAGCTIGIDCCFCDVCCMGDGLALWMILVFGVSTVRPVLWGVSGVSLLLEPPHVLVLDNARFSDCALGIMYFVRLDNGRTGPAHLL